MSEENASFARIVDSLLQGMQAMVRQVERVGTEVSEVRADVRRLRVDQARSSGKSDDLSRLVQNGFKAVDSRFDGLETELERLAAKVSADMTEIAHVQVQILNAVQAANAIRTEYDDHEERLRALEEKVSGLGL